MKLGSNAPGNDNAGEAQDKPSLLLTDNTEPKRYEHLFSAVPRDTTAQEPNLEQRLLNYIEMRAHEKLFSGSRLGFDRESKLDAAQLFYEVKFLNQNPDKLLKNENAIAALNQGRLGKITSEAVTQLVADNSQTQANRI